MSVSVQVSDFHITKKPKRAIYKVEVRKVPKHNMKNLKFCLIIIIKYNYNYFFIHLDRLHRYSN